MNNINEISSTPSIMVRSQDTTTRTLIILLLFVVVGCWAAMIWAGFHTYQYAPPLPEKFVSSSGQELMLSEGIISGKAAFQKADLMDYGSLYGMGSYFGIDYTAQYLVEIGQKVNEELSLKNYGKSFADLLPEQQYLVQRDMQAMLKEIALNESTVIIPDVVANVIIKLRQEITQSLLQHDFVKGWTKAYSLDNSEAENTANFFIYSVFTTIAHRPNQNISWTNNWPYEPSVGNEPATKSFMWTWGSLTLLFFSIGLVLAIFRLFIEDKTEHPIKENILEKFGNVTPSQMATGKFFIFAALLLLVQIAAGAILAHAYVERDNFYGINILEFLPFNFLRDVHLQAPIVWIGLGWIASALFLAPFIGGREPRGQKVLVNIILWLIIIIVVGALLGNYLGIMGVIDKWWFWFGNQGLSYIQLGRFWQILFFVGLLFWSLVLLRAMWPTLKGLLQRYSIFSLFRVEHLLWYSTLGVAFIYTFGMIPLLDINTSFTITDYWRWWVVHLWVEWAFELFAVATTGYFLMATGLISRQLAERAILFEWILILGSGILGTGHHLFWAGAPDIWISLGAIFGFLEVLPLFLLIIESIEQYFMLNNRANFKYRLAFLFILGSAFWNFVGAGVFGAAINAPLMNYYEHGTFLTLNHAHTAMFGAFGLLSFGLMYVVLRYLVGDRAFWSERLGVWAFWLYNLGLVLWIVLNFFPIGWAQLQAVYEHGYAYARSLEFYNQTLLWQWLRMPGDVIFAIAALLMAWDIIKKVRASR